MAKTRTYFCIDMKSFYASVECAERGYNPFETNLVVADLTRGKNALCLAITPAMKAQGIRNRCRLSEIPSNVKYEVAPPRMALYIEYAADIYSLYLDYFDPRDIHVYSIDESFLDVTDYLAPNHMDAVTFAKHLMNEIADRFHVPLLRRRHPRDQPRQERQRTPVHNPPQRRHERNAHKHVRRWTQ